MEKCQCDTCEEQDRRNMEYGDKLFDSLSSVVSRSIDEIPDDVDYTVVLNYALTALLNFHYSSLAQSFEKEKLLEIIDENHKIAKEFIDNEYPKEVQ